MRLQRADRRRLVFASALTVIALPAVWLANRDDEGSRPNVAAVGLAAEDASGSEREGVPPTHIDPMGQLDPLFSDEPTAESVGTVAVAVGGTASAILATPFATYSRSVGSDTCHYDGLAAGTEVTIVNPANGRALDCVISPNGEDDELTLHPDRFALLADLTVAPVRVEIHRQG